jgi:hypothetical protein
VLYCSVDGAVLYCSVDGASAAFCKAVLCMASEAKLPKPRRLVRFEQCVTTREPLILDREDRPVRSSSPGWLTRLRPPTDYEVWVQGLGFRATV